MITKLSIANFKSIKQLDIDCKKVNVFVGEPNAGKSNILEALGLLSWCDGSGPGSLRDYVRFQSIQNLFYDQLLDQAISVSLLGSSSAEVHVGHVNDRFEFRKGAGSDVFATMDYEGNMSLGLCTQLSKIRFYRFMDLPRYDDKEAGSLMPPNGTDLFSVVFTSETLRDTKGVLQKRQHRPYRH